MIVLLQHEWIHAILVPQHWVLDRECKNILIKNMQEYKGDLKEWRSSLFKVHFLFSQNVKKHTLIENARMYLCESFRF
jgi:hypothetical protein